MCREGNGIEMKKTGKRLFILISCLILLSGIGMLLYMAGRKPEEGEGRAELDEMADIEEDDDIFRQMGGFDNPIDERYLPVIFASNGEDKVAVLESYENAWKGQLEKYLEDYRSRCRYAKDKEMSEEYFAAVQMAADAQKELMEYMGVEADGQFWYSAQIYRCAFIKDVQGEFTTEEADWGVMNVGLKEMQVLAGVNYEVCGGFVNDIDKRYAVSMYEGCEADIKCRQEAFDLDWCNELGTLTMKFYENLDEEGRRLAGIWQQSRENWKAAADVRFWRTPEELNAEPEDAVLCGDGTNSALMEKDGWINRLYCQQLNSMMEKNSKEGFRVNEQLSIYSIEEGIGDDCEQVWQMGREILGVRDEDAWEHYTWYMANKDTGERMGERLVLYRTMEGEQGFFL